MIAVARPTITGMSSRPTSYNIRHATRARACVSPWPTVMPRTSNSGLARTSARANASSMSPARSQSKMIFCLSAAAVPDKPSAHITTPQDNQRRRIFMGCLTNRARSGRFKPPRPRGPGHRYPAERVTLPRGCCDALSQCRCHQLAPEVVTGTAEVEAILHEEFRPRRAILAEHRCPHVDEAEKLRPLLALGLDQGVRLL